LSNPGRTHEEADRRPESHHHRRRCRYRARHGRRVSRSGCARVHLRRRPCGPRCVPQVASKGRRLEEATGFLGGLDVLVNNAGIAGPTGPVEEISQEDWRRTLAINLEGQFLCTRRAVPLLRQAGGGCIINLSSAAGRFGFARRTPYSASKWGVVGFTKSLAVELGPDNIRVNAILPGAVDGPRIQRVISAKADSLGVLYEEMEKRYVSQASLRRMVTADDIAGMAVFLASPAGYNISGQALAVDADTQYLV
jgi:NAD(P)-dependent dehydrogenase (short-subunit alcohol dehydrogenase family)